jgi:predicted HicB family RNase H-like nuclease
MGTKRKRPGRPPKRPDQLKSKSLLVRLAPTEKRAFADAAELAGVPLSIWVRERLRREAARELGEADRPIAFFRHSQTG